MTMKISSAELIKDLKARTSNVLEELKSFKNLPEVRLNQKLSNDSWSMFECIEHLNMYGRFYIPEMKGRMEQSNHPVTSEFKSSWLGEYFAKSMLPKEKLNKMNTFKDKNPMGSTLDFSALDELIEQQEQLLELLDYAANKNLTKIKTSITISNLIKLRLGDTFRVVIYHNQRHLEQAKRVLRSISN